MDLGKRLLYATCNTLMFLLVYWFFTKTTKDSFKGAHNLVLLGAWMYGMIMSYLWHIHDVVTGRTRQSERDML